jgi:nicotinate phosphoribosyltransferase
MTAFGHPLLLDLYMLTMLQAFHDEGMQQEAVYEFYIRSLPPRRGFLVAAGLEQALEYLESLSFSADDLEFLASTGRFSASFLDSLAKLRFTGDVYAMREGTVCFPDEPLLRVVAPIPQAQLVETRLINLLHFQTMVASKAARCVLAAPGKLLVDFGLRRAHGSEAGLLAARASYVAGFAGTATVLAEERFGIPTYGTMAHAYIQAHESESEAFEAFARSQPRNAILLIDTYDTEAAARKVAALAPRLARDGIVIRAVRLDSGDLAQHAFNVRKILDDAGLREIGIFASGNVDEDALRALVASGAPIDGFGVGTRLTTSADAPSLDCAYKLVEFAGHPRRKRSEGKASLPGRKQVFRVYDERDGTVREDVVTVEGDVQPGEPLLELVMRGGKRVAPPEPLAAARERAAQGLAKLPALLRELREGATCPVRIAPALRALVAEADRSARE